MEYTKFLIFLLGQQKFGVELSIIKGIEHVYHIVPMPNSPRYVKGIINLRNETIPIFDIKSKFNKKEDMQGTNKQLLVAESHDMKIGFEVDDVISIVEITESDIMGVPQMFSSGDTEYLGDILKVKLDGMQKEEVVLSVSVDKIMSSEDFSNLAMKLEEAKQNTE